MKNDLLLHLGWATIVLAVALVIAFFTGKEPQYEESYPYLEDQYNEVQVDKESEYKMWLYERQNLP